MPFWRKSEDPWDMEPEKRRTWTAGEPQPPAARRGGVEGPRGEGDSGGADAVCHDLPLVRAGDADGVSGGRKGRCPPGVGASPARFAWRMPNGTLYLRGDGSFWSDYKLAWHCGACRKLVLDTANCTRAEHLTSEEINRRIIYGADAEHLSESREEE